MPIRKVKGGYKWGSHGKVYPSRKGAERQAAAAYASGYTGKAEINYKNEKVDGEMLEKKKLKKEIELVKNSIEKIENQLLTKSVDSVLDSSNSIINKKIRRRGRHRPTMFKPKDYFAVKQSDTLQAVQLPQNRIYLKEGEEPPAGAFVQMGPRGGKFYIDQKRQVTQEEQKEGRIAGSMPMVQVQPHTNPEREVDSELEENKTLEVPDAGVSTLRIIREALTEDRVPVATPNKLGYQIVESPAEINVLAVGPGSSTRERKNMAGRIERAISSTGLDFEREGDVVHVQHLKSDPAIAITDVVEDNGLVEEVDPNQLPRIRRVVPLDNTKKLLNDNILRNSKRLTRVINNSSKIEKTFK